MKNSSLCRIILALLVFLGACSNEKVEKEPEIKEENKINEENEIKIEAEEDIDAIRVVYYDGTEKIIANKEFIKRFTAEMEEAMEKKEVTSNRTDFGRILCSAYFGNHVLTIAEVGYASAIDGNYWISGDSAIEVLLMNCLEDNAYFAKFHREEHVDSIYKFFENSITERTGQEGIIKIIEIKGIYPVLEAINPVYDFNQDLYIYNFYNREKMEYDKIIYDWKTQTAKMGVCEYTEDGQKFSNCSDFEIAWMQKMLNSFLVNVLDQYMDYPTFIREVEEYKKATWEKFREQE